MTVVSIEEKYLVFDRGGAAYVGELDITILFFIFPTPMISHMCFREKLFSGGKIALRVNHRVHFGTPNFSRISEYIGLINIFFSHAS